MLSAMVQVLSVQLNNFGGIINLGSEDPHLEMQKVGESTVSVSEGFPIRISCDMDNENGILDNYELLRYNYTQSKMSGATNIIQKLTKEEGCIWPLISYQRFDREWKLGRNTGKTVFLPSFHSLSKR